jgi:hypothetical protein
MPTQLAAYVHFTAAQLAASMNAPKQRDADVHLPPGCCTTVSISFLFYLTMSPPFLVGQKKNELRNKKGDQSGSSVGVLVFRCGPGL